MKKILLIFTSIISLAGFGQTYYSQSNGNLTDPIWSTSVSGTPVYVTIDSNSSFVLQHNVNVDSTATVDSITVKENCVLSVGPYSLSFQKILLKSSSLGTGSIGQINNSGSLSGNVSIETYIPPRLGYPYGSWVGMGSCIPTTIADWNDDIVTTGFTGSDYPTYPLNSVQYYNEAVSGVMNNGYQLASNITNNVLDQGYFVYMESASQNIKVTGQVKSHNFNDTLSYTNNGLIFHDGWNLMVNQYPSEIDFDKLCDSSYFNPLNPQVFYVYDCDSLNYLWYNASINGIGSNHSRYIPINQSFWMKANNVGNILKYKEIHKSNSGEDFDRDEDEIDFDGLSIHISNNVSADDCTLIFGNGTSNLDWNIDVIKMDSPEEIAAECAFLLDDNVKASIESRPIGNWDIPLYIKVGGGNTLIKFNYLDIPDNICFFLENTESGEITYPSQGTSILLEEDVSFSGTRYILHFRTSIEPTLEYSVDNCNISNDGSINCNFNSYDQCEFSVVNSTGTVVYGGFSSGFSMNSMSSDNYEVLIQTSCGEVSIPVNLIDDNIVDVEILSDDITIDFDQEISIYQDSQNSSQTIWMVDDYMTSSDVLTYNFTQGTHTVYLTGLNENCSDIDSITVNVLNNTVGIEISSNDQVTICQGPYSTYLVSKSNIGESIVSLHDINGKLIESYSVYLLPGTRIDFDKTKSSGIYFISVEYVDCKQVIVNKSYIKSQD